MLRRVETMLIIVLVGRPLFSQQVIDAFPNLSFHQPTFLTYATDDSNRIFVAQQDGVILVFPNDSSAAVADTFLNLSNFLSSSGGEEGLLGLAFDPAFALNGFFYVDFTAPAPLRTVVKRFTVPAATPNRADASSGFPIIEIAQPYSNHNGGMLAFGPDGYFYIGMGDGGSSGDPLNNAQDRTKLLGKILRIDVRDTTSISHYTIPPDNPFAGNSTGFREEIWAYGLRNPWRFSFDPVTGQLWVGDVGQNQWEEVDLIERGKNYGWSIMEATHCYNPATGCDTTGLTLPITEYSHSLGSSVTGGYIYRGAARPDLTGAYVYGDFGSGRIWMLKYVNGTLITDSLLLQIPHNISSFGVDSRQELYIVTYSTSTTNKIYRFSGGPTVSVERKSREAAQRDFSLGQNYANPFNPTTKIQFTIVNRQLTIVKVYDVLGSEVATLVNEVKEPGTYTVQFEGRNLASGVYFYRLITGKYAETRRMLLLR